MVFSSSIFLFVFLPFVLLGYYLIRVEYRNVFLLLSSLFFYAWGEPKYILIIILSILINYFSGLIIGFTKKNCGIALNRMALIIAVSLNLCLLFYFKYYDFFISTVNSFGGLKLPLKDIVLPLGISFFTFQGMSYTLDLYLDKIEMQKNPLNLALFMTMFPHLIAGPIVRYKDIIGQIESRDCDIDKFSYGVRRFVKGLAKKMIIANQLGLVADQVFSLPANQNSPSIAWVGIICYTFQIYFDFSGYSDMAIGLARMFGFEFMENFNFPYISKSITEFWRRWHISLSSWFRDYVYIPLGGNRKGNVYIHLLVVFTITGLWHGASWNFIIWGLWHGAFIITERILKKKNININIPSPLKWVYTILVVMIGWVLFRSPDLNYALQYMGVMFGLVKSVNVGFSIYWYLTPKVITILIIAVLASISIKDMIPKTIEQVKGTYLEVICANVWTVLLLGLSIMLVMTSTYNPFIYFRF